jgi:hypothetical protein
MLRNPALAPPCNEAVWHGEDPQGVDLNRHLLSILSYGSTLELRRQNKGDCR